MKLTHKFTDLQDEFKIRVEATGSEPAVAVKLREQLKEREETITRLRAKIRELTNDQQQLERVINVLSLEQQHGRTDKSTVVGIRQPRDGR
ncbi:hypothetical protein C1H84_05980 [Glutamicibacter soli]|uniref:Uncharacterized protein n=1 Tax=Glutamicibacter soli TaxID=453836 RepID=A0A365YJW6_9MICC|nr:hypothetical protein C1H84_05980 [Glutamicibacter soli]